MTDDDYITTGEAARLLRVSPETIRRRCATGRIPGAMRIDSGRWKVPRSWVQGILDAVRPVRRRAGIACEMTTDGSFCTK